MHIKSHETISFKYSKKKRTMARDSSE